MSFVLEALKKQEAGVDPDAAVSLARNAAQHRRHRLWMGLFAVAMAVNAGLLVWMYAEPPAPPAGTALPASTAGEVSEMSRPQQGVPTRRRAAEPTVAAEPPPDQRATSAVESPSASPEPAVAARSRITPEAPTSAPAEQAAPPRAEPERISLGELPSDARARFPGIAFSTHIYAEDPDLRAVVANGRRLKEGEYIRGLEILQITASGVVLAFENYRVEVPMVTDWDAL